MLGGISGILREGIEEGSQRFDWGAQLETHLQSCLHSDYTHASLG